eukprot:TRINITY_DN3586_c0_g1_i1.p1 TRINITY_DN3586_c0_g1~~TRINITY_DN3586_c0_g1_i1.p1  ORF type:complete len:396 (+),score=80.81 TRINITY_DN3586_c0_g1_i1:132-1319(+)
MKQRKQSGTQARIEELQRQPVQPEKPFWSFENVRGILLERVYKEQPYLVSLQKALRCPPLDVFFFVSSQLGEEVFYILFIPFSAWLFPMKFALHLSMLLALSVGGGNYLKNYFHLPRPSPPVWIQNDKVNDHGFPSTHTMSSFIFAVYSFYFFYLDPERADSEHLLPLPLAFLLGCFWFFSVSFSRLYNGFHSPIDIAGGLVFSSLLLTIFFNFRDNLNLSCSSENIFVPIVLFTAGLLGLFYHPRPPEPNAVVSESALVIGVAMGAACSCWVNFKLVGSQCLSSLAPDATDKTGFLSQFPLVSRCLVGLLTLGIVRLIGKLTYRSFITKFILPYRSFFQKYSNPQSASETEVKEILTKYFTYFTISITTVTILPFVFAFLDVGPQNPVSHWIVG